MSSRFDDETAVHRTGDGRSGRRWPSWWVHRGPNGGYLAAVILRALAAAVDDPTRTARSLTVHYANPAGAGDVEITTRLERVGRSMTTCLPHGAGRHADRARRRRVLDAAGGLEFCDLVMPQVPGPQHYVARPVPPEAPPIARRTRPAGRAPPAGPDARGAPRWPADGSPAGPARRGPAGGCRDHGRLAAADVQPHPGARAAPPTVDLTIHFRAALPHPGLAADAFVLASFCTTVVAADGFLEEDGEIRAPRRHAPRPATPAGDDPAAPLVARLRRPGSSGDVTLGCLR